MTGLQLEPDQILEDVREMVRTLEEAKFYGPYHASFDGGKTWITIEDNKPVIPKQRRSKKRARNQKHKSKSRR